MDERQALHRYKSTSHAGVAGAVLMGVWFFYEQVGRGIFRMDLLAIMLAMLVVKLSAMAWYRVRD
jgi:hypothetical protein